MKPRNFVLALLLSVAPVASGQDLPSAASFQLRLIARRTTYPASATELTADKKPFCFVALEVELKNMSNDTLELALAPEPELLLTGPRTESVQKVSLARFYMAQEGRLKLEAGATHRIALRTLSYRVGAEQFQVFWQEPGAYSLQAVYRMSATCVPREKGLPELKAAVVIKSVPLKLTILEGSVSDYWTQALVDADPALRRAALANLTEMGAQASSAIPRLVQVAHDKNADLRIKAVQALAAIGPKGSALALPALRRSLNDEEAEVRRSALTAISRVAPNHRETPATLRSFLQSDDAKMRIAAAQALRYLGFNGHRPDEADTAALLQALKAERVTEARRSFIDALCHHPRLEVLAALVPYITAEDKSTRHETMHTLSRIVPFVERDRKKNKQLGRPIENTVAALIEAMKDREMVRLAVHCLGTFGADAALAVDALVEALDDPAHQALDLFGHPRVPIVQALRDIGPPARRATGALAARVRSDPDWSVRQYAAQALAGIGPDAAQAVPDLKQALKDRMDQVRNEAITALAKIGASDALLENLDDENPLTRRSIIHALAGMKEPARKIVPALARRLTDDPDAANRRSAASVLGSFGTGAAAAVPSLGKALKDKDADVRLSAVEALGSIGREARTAIPALVELMKTDRVDRNRERAGWSMVSIGVQKETAIVPELARQVLDANPAVALPAVVLLGQLGPDAREALPALRQAQTRSPLTDTARMAIRQIEAGR